MGAAPKKYAHVQSTVGAETNLQQMKTVASTVTGFDLELDL